MTYLLSNICTTDYWNPTIIVEIIVGGWVVSFFCDAVYSASVVSPILAFWGINPYIPPLSAPMITVTVTEGIYIEPLPPPYW